MQLNKPASVVGWITLAAATLIVGCRVWLAVDVPLTDTTEARYGEMARKMVETGDWMMPQHDYGVPYLAKPPLAIWLSAAGIELLGPHELGPRLLILLSAIGFLVYLHRWVRREIGPGAAATSVLMLMGSMLFFVSMAAVMTDLVLVACVNIALLAFWQRIHGNGRFSEPIFFVMAGLGLLAKGPLAVFLIAVPIAIWALICRRSVDVWQRIAWFRGLSITALIAVPWYLAAEWQHPGFLRYFLIGENLQRFLISDWPGDLYGPVHELPHGAIWIFLLIAALPWSFIIPVLIVRRRGTIRHNWQQHRELAVYVLAAAVVPMLLFTAAKNVIFPYALPALVPAVIAAVVLLGDAAMGTSFVTWTASCAATAALAFSLGTAILQGKVEQESERELVVAVESELATPADKLYYWRHRYYSAEYYSRGQTAVLHSADEIEQILAQGQPFYIAMKDDQFDTLPKDIRSSLRWLGHYSKKSLYGPVRYAATATHTATLR